MKKGFLAVLLSVFGLLLGCQGTQSPVPIPSDKVSLIAPLDGTLAEKQNPIQVGMLLPLSGKNAALADDLRNAGILAQFELAGENYTLSFYDTKGTAQGAKVAFNQAMDEQVQMVLGPLFSEEVKAIRSMAKDKNIPVFSFTSDEDVLSRGVYSLALTIPNQTNRIIRFACEKGAKRLAIMAPDNKAGDLAIDTAKKAADSCGMEVVKLSVYNPTFINFEPYVLSVLPESVINARKEKIAEKKNKRLKKEVVEEPQDETEAQEEVPIKNQLEFDALFIADGGNRLKSISSLFGLYDVYPSDVLFLGLSGWYEPSLSNEGSLKGSYFPLLPKEGFEKFAQKFQETYGKQPNRLASLAYDAVALSLVLNANNAALGMPQGFWGVDGLFRFTEKGASERLMAIYKIAGPKRFVRVEKPSSSFNNEDWKKEQLQDIKIINNFVDANPVVYEEPTEQMPQEIILAPTSESTDLTSTILP